MKCCKFAKFFADYESKAQGLSKSVSDVIDLCHNKKIEGGGVTGTPPHADYFGKPDVSLNRVNIVYWVPN